ncbi:hypothetical protein [Mycoavidus sp. B2-EB]|uniref:hypothetical protein n=1 Tax=Mycoavidus sp. B2-EB TaxID=2651972 RepID=UPI0016294CEB|nr:hypothetical protein [Mycoavidus sp. B2-EB]BBO59842.1 hypothetical protein MPB2EB_0968 [Mycoavidus sp. B2-EB]
MHHNLTSGLIESSILQICLNDETARSALHGVLAYGGAVARGQSGSSAALGGSASVWVNHLLGPVEGSSEEEKETRKNIVTSLVAGVARVGGADAASAQNAAQIETENNAAVVLAAPLAATPPGVVVLSVVAAGLAAWNAYKAYQKNRVNEEDEEQLILPPPPTIFTPMEPPQSHQIPGRAWHQDEEVLLEGMPNQSGEHLVQPLVYPNKSGEYTVAPLIQPIAEAPEKLGNMIFSEGVKEEKTDEQLVSKIFGGNRTILENTTSRGTKVESIPDGTKTTADADFDALGLNDIRSIDTNYGQGRVGHLPDGTTVIVRPSRDGRPTIEFQSSSRTIREIRYGRP